ncbi:TPA: GNAT family N-acetyltransferase [Elizabethkingia anophelis]|nr:GNAT family N-acetyltransferase [Elizabethkingia anophelis]HBN6707268.1 GNAT family N-acetyltransferase [Elizabethkingia anophelis]HBN6711302.1 GNAT family N-acetyltransferase [Elizabethkingia anophelis]HBN6714088.1 GNAT family N-acetyltransferase [Elizabethkingia anophelis]HBN6719626.1 GNAT family N-acetyltransferase [Elizabethkingia anophelis]
MNTDQFFIRKAVIEDLDKIFDLYKLVSKTIGGLARTENEITKDYVKNFIEKSLRTGIQFVIVDKLLPEKIMGEIHCYKLEPSVFVHVLSELTIAVDIKYQDRGLGRKLFQTLFDFILVNRNDIFRLELIARESNSRAIKLYEKLGFKIEGRFENRIKTDENLFEADIPMAWFNPNFK